MASIEDRFEAAINVIKGLPKNGPYQPTTAMMLQFYGLFKQATVGACHQKRPGFWDIVGRAKWDAWNSNRHLTKQQAMEKYVEGLREIIETMSFTENVQNFVGSLSGLDNINLDELDMIAPGMRELAESHPNSPFNSRTNSPQHGSSSNVNSKGDEVKTTPTVNGHHVEHQNDDRNGSDSAETITSLSTPTAAPETESLRTNIYTPMTNGIVDQSDDEYGDPVDMQNEFTEALLNNSELLKQIQATVLRMNSDIANVTMRMGNLEKSMKAVHVSVNEMRNSGQRSRSVTNKGFRQYPKWWPFENISPLWFVLLILWPFIARRLNNMLTSPRRK